VYALPPVSATKSSPSVVLLYRFGPYEADASTNELRKFGLRVRLERKPWQLLIALLVRAGKVVTRSELHHSLWDEDVFVDFDTGLNVAVKKLRGALCDSIDGPAYIDTVVGEGYCFVAAVEKVLTTANAPASGPQESIPAVVLPPIPVAPVAPAIQTKLNSVAAEASPVAEAPLLQPKEGLERSLPAGRARQSRLWKRKVWPALAVAVCVALFAAVTARLGWRRLREPASAHAGKIMLVVLPFENLSGDPGQEYFSDGMTEELSAQLGNLSPQRLAVIGRTSAMIYKHSPKTISQIGKDLGVGYVLEGSVRRDGSKLRVTAQLVQVSDQAHVWAQNYDRDVRDLLQVEDDVASDIARQVGVSFALGQPTKSLYSHTPNSEAHEAYLLARYYWNKRTPAGWAAGEQYFRRAIDKDPVYAAAYAGLAECRIPKQEALAAATKAVELDPTSGEARTALGWVELYKELDLAAAEDALKRAVQLDPNYAPSHHTYSQFLVMTGRFHEAISEETLAVLLDPLSNISRASLAGLLLVAGQNDRGVEQLKMIFAMDPQYPKAHEVLGDIYSRRGMYKEAIREYQASEQYGGAKLLGLLGYAYARSGNKDQALRTLSELQELEKRSGSGDVSYDLALIEIGLGHWDGALAWLEKEYQQHDDDGLLFLKYDPIFAPLRSDPRFQNLLRRMNFPS
jgi:TolB-like protein/DNA-binding winged helix-turn-helix (wHTH) protein/Flp pilus assembly protein TadD